jgi:Fe2+ or Zn2+ uptake regulation protein
MTPQRLAILHVLRHAGTHMTPSEVYKLAKRELPRMTEPTVYRTLEFLAENGLARPSHAGNGHFTYEIAGDDHHHIICRVCGSEIEIEHSILANFYQTLEKASGYQNIDSHLTFLGICPGCSAS